MICLLCGSAFSQSFYVTDQAYRFKRITINGSSITTEDIASCPARATSIALQHKVMYYISEKVLYKADLSGNTLSNCTLLGSVSNSNSLTIDKNGLLYLTNDGGSLLTFDPKTLKLTTIGSMPYAPAGDLVFYKDELYMASLSGIVKVNIADPSKSIIVIASQPSILGLASVSVSGTVNKVYALDNNSTSTATTIIEVDLDNYRLGQTIGVSPSFYYDAASDVEDGSYLKLDIDKVDTYADCPFTGKGTVNVTSYKANTFILKNNVSGATVTNNTGKFTGVDPGNYIITVRNGLESIFGNYVVNQFTFVKPGLTITTKKPNCLNTGEIAITADKINGDFDIVYNGTAYGSDHTFTGLTAKKYHFDIRNSTGCVVDSRDVDLVQDACVIKIDSASVSEECDNPNKGHVVVHASPGTDSYTYTLGSTTNTTGVFSNLDAARGYIISVTSKGDGSKQYPVIIPDYTLNKPTITYDKTDASCSVNASVNFKLSVTNVVYTISYKSSVYSIDHKFLLPDAGTYSFKILKPNGCVLANITVPIVKIECEVVQFPNTFSPNGDGINDIFRPSQGAVTDKLQIKIYNRLGALIFTSDNQHNGWDGQTNGKPVPAGVYYWLATYINNEKLSKSQSGSITLIR